MSTTELQFTVVVNHEDQYSVWRADQEPPSGWRGVGVTGTRAECLDHIERVWVDMRPLSARGELGLRAPG
jgi:MbtH protein